MHRLLLFRKLPGAGLACTSYSLFPNAVSLYSIEIFIASKVILFHCRELVPSPAYVDKIKTSTTRESTDTPKPDSQTNGATSTKIAKDDVPVKKGPPHVISRKTTPPKRFDAASVKPITELIKAEKSVEVSAPPNNTKVVISYIHNHRCIFIRSVEPAAEFDYQKIQTDCAEYVKIAMPLTVLPLKGHIVLARYHLDSMYYRALVVKAIDEGNIKVAFIDFGNTEKTKLSELKHLREDLQLRRMYNFRVLLDGVDEKLNNQDVMNFLKGLVHTKILKLLYDDTKPLKDALVKLVDTVTGGILNERVHSLNGVKGVKIIDTDTAVEIVNDCVDTRLNRNGAIRLTEAPIGLNALDKVDISGDDVHLVVLSNSQLCNNQISCVRIEDLNELVNNCENLQEHCTKVQDTYTPK